jgi:hypothetical protein
MSSWFLQKRALHVRRRLKQSQVYTVDHDFTGLIESTAIIQANAMLIRLNAISDG